MADIHDVIAAEDQVSQTLLKAQEVLSDVEREYLETKAVCEAILAVGIRLDYVIRDVTKLR